MLVCYRRKPTRRFKFMILTCEQCHTRYLLPTHLLGADGRRVRCTICSHEWFQTPEEDESAVAHEETHESFAEILSQAGDDSVNLESQVYETPILAEDSIPPEKKRFFRRQPGLGTGLMAAVLVGVLLLTALLMFRGPVTKIWPDSLALYTAVGLAGPIPGDGLVFEDLKATTSYNAQGVEILRLVGNIRNVRTHRVRVPALRFALRDAEGKEVETWTYPSPNADIEAEEKIPLDVSYPQIPATAKELNVKFIED